MLLQWLWQRPCVSLSISISLSLTSREPAVSQSLGVKYCMSLFWVKPQLYSLADVRTDSCGHYRHLVFLIILLSSLLGVCLVRTMRIRCPCSVVVITKNVTRILADSDVVTGEESIALAWEGQIPEVDSCLALLSWSETGQSHRKIINKSRA